MSCEGLQQRPHRKSYDQVEPDVATIVCSLALFGSSLEFETDTGTFPTDREEFPQEDSRITGSMPERYSKLMVEKYRGRA